MSLTEKNFDEEIKKQRCTLVRFFTHHQEQSVRSYEDYNLVAKSFRNISSIRIAGLDCGKYRRECLKRNVFDIPCIRLYCNSTVYQYDGGFSFESINSWVANLTGITPKKIDQQASTPNGRTFNEMIHQNKCVLTFFHTPWCNPCKRFAPRFSRLARLFSDIETVKFASIDADRYRTFIRDYDINFFPDIRLFIKDKKKPLIYSGKRKINLLIKFINENCGTSKEIINTELSEGLIEQANLIVEEFFKNGQNQLYLKKMKEISNAQYYLFVMKNCLEKGVSFIKEEKDKLSSLINEADVSQKELVSMRRKINVLTFFQTTFDGNK